MFSFRNTIGVSNGLDQDQDRPSVSPDVGPTCLQRLPPGDKSRRKEGKSYSGQMPLLITYMDTFLQYILNVHFRAAPGADPGFLERGFYV